MYQTVRYVGVDIDHKVGDVTEFGPITKVAYLYDSNETEITIKEVLPFVCMGDFDHFAD